MSHKPQIAILSDIHIGDNTPTCWYQKSFHEPYFLAALDWVIENAISIEELILLGDLVDFWTYPPNHVPPTFQEIMDANPNVFGPTGKLSQVLTALEGKVSYLHGNHDIDLTQADLDLIRNPQGYKITLREDIYYPFYPDRRILCTHGHHFTLFNAPDRLTELHIPVGHFVTRAVAYYMQRTLHDNETVADLPGNGAPGGLSAFVELFASILADPNPLGRVMNTNLPRLLLEAIQAVTGIPDEEMVYLPNGKQVMFGQAKTLYADLLRQWVMEAGGGSVLDGIINASKAALADNDGTYLAWFAQKLAFEKGAFSVATGHTHAAKVGIHQSDLGYVNAGYECPAKPDINAPAKHFNFGLMYARPSDRDTRVYRVNRTESTYTVSRDEVGSDALVFGLSMDFSCYITIRNPQPWAWTLQDTESSNGYFVVRPPARIEPGETVRIWIQDYPLSPGAAGNFSYAPVEGPPEATNVKISVECPVSSGNKVMSTHPFFAKSGDAPWGERGEVPYWGHPLFVLVDLYLPDPPMDGD
jgi:UDP-2,3-diacylglucosamine pyrophosphatase LpxH